MQVPLGEEAPLAGVPNLALRRERAPNLRRRRAARLHPAAGRPRSQALSAAVVLVLDAELSAADEAALASAAGVVIVLGSVVADSLRNAELVLPVTTMAEENGTYVNRDRRLQRYQQAKVAARHGAAGLVGGGRGARRARTERGRAVDGGRGVPLLASGGRCSRG